MTKHVMVDLETLGTKPGCPVLSIGAVVFNPREGVLGETFYVVADQDQSQWGLKPSSATIAWWAHQSVEARSIFTDEARVDLRSMLSLFKVWWSDNLRDANDEVLVWGNGADFDIPILGAAYDAVDLAWPWKPFSGRCYRTIKNLRPDIKIKRHGEHHNALADAIAQAVHLMDIQEGSTLTLA